jgi:hypothetical protein
MGRDRVRDLGETPPFQTFHGSSSSRCAGLARFDNSQNVKMTILGAAKAEK